jgi:thiol-disulfide isomerase/thioredoxin
MTQKTKKPAAGAPAPRNRSILWWSLGGIVGLALIILLALSIVNEEAPDPGVAFGTPVVEGDPLPVYASGTEDAAIGTTAPSAQGADWNDTPVTIEPDGTPKIVVFLAHWCPHCQAEVPVIQQWIDDGNLPDDVEMISISTLANEVRDNFPPNEWLEQEGWTPPVMLDDEVGSLALAYGLGSTPQFMVLDGENTNLIRVSGELTTEQLNLLVDVAQESIAG